MSPRVCVPRAAHGFALCALWFLALLVALPAVSATNQVPADRRVSRKTPQPLSSSRANRSEWFWFDDLEPPDPGWTHGDFTETVEPHFHIDAYMAYSGLYSWWCGTFDYDDDGGYGNRWDERLNIPPVDWTGYTYPVIMFHFRNDTEPYYDLTYVEAESNGVFVQLNYGYNGTIEWRWDGFYLGYMDNPTVLRFRFRSDACWSDEDGYYDSSGGAFMCDEIQVMDYYTGEVFFYDDAEGGGLCTPSAPPIAGDHWHTISSNCKAWSDPTVWVNTQIDTPGYVAPNVQNWLTTPMVDISCATTCTTYYVFQFFTPWDSWDRERAYGPPADHWTEEVTVDGGETWTQLHVWPGGWGPSDQCDWGYGPCDHFLGSDDITSLLPGTRVALRWTYYSNDDGVGPDVCGNAGITLDNIGFFGEGSGGWPTPHIAVSDSLLLFGPVVLGASTTRGLVVSNQGLVPLTVSDISTDHGDFMADPTSFVVPPCGSQSVGVEFAPSSVGSVSATLTILSDDPDAGTLEIALEGEGIPPPDVAVSPSSLYADLPTGGAETQYLTIENTGPGELIWSAYAGERAGQTDGRARASGPLRASSSERGGFRQPLAFADVWPAADTVLSQSDGGFRDVPWLSVDPASGAIPPGGTAEVAVTFDAYGLFGGDYLADLFIVSNDPDEPEVAVAVHLHVTGAPDIALSDALLSYGQVYVTVTAHQTLEVVNEGTDTLHVTALGIDAPEFTTDTTPFALGDGGVRSLDVAFSPVTAGVVTGTLTIASDDPDEGVLEVALEGEGVPPPDIAVSPDSLHVDLLTGETDLQYVTIENSGESELVWEAEILTRAEARRDRIRATRGRAGLELVTSTFSSPKSGGAREVPWVTADPSSGIIPAGGSAEVAITFDAAGLFGGDYLAELLVSSNDPDEPEVPVAIHLRVTGVPDIAVSDTLLQFGPVFVGWSGEQTVLILNEGTDLLTVSDISANHGDFSAEPTSFGLPPGESQSVTVEFAPSGEGPISATLTVLSDDPDEDTVEITLEGEGVVPPEVSVTPDSLRADLLTGATQTQYVTIENAGGSELVWEVDLIARARGRGSPARTPHQEVDLPVQTEMTTLERDGGTRQVLWLSADPPAGTIPPGGVADVAVTFDAYGLLGGDYLADLLVLSNDPDDPAIAVAVHLHVTGAPDIAVSDAVLSFGGVFIGWSATDTLFVSNWGTEELTVAGVSTDHADFAVDPMGFVLSPGESHALPVEFTPSTEGLIAATLTILSDDPDEGLLEIVLEGEGLVPPEFVASPDSLDADLMTGETDTKYVTIGNPGGSDLVWWLGAVRATGAGEAAPESPPRTRPTESVNEGWRDPRGSSGVLAPRGGGRIAELAGVRILWDSAHGWGIGDHGLAVQDLIDRGATVTVNHQHITPDVLAGCNVLWSADCGLPWIQDEVEALESWVESGGGLLLQGDYTSSVEAFNGILSSLDAGIEFSTIHGTEGVTPNVRPHLTTLGVDLIYLWENNAHLSSVSAPASVLIDDAGGVANTAWSEVGFGRILASADLLFDDGHITECDNRLFARQAFDWLAGGAGWIAVEPDAGAVPAGSYADVGIVFDPGLLPGGDYLADVVFRSNDPLVPEISIATRLHVTGVPDIAVSDTLLYFGVIEMGSAVSETLLVSNEGVDQLVVAEINVDHGDFSANPASFDLLPAETQAVVVEFAPSSEGPISGTLTILSNDPDEGTVEVMLFARGESTTPVESSFFATLTGSETVMLRWVAPSLADAQGLNVYRATSQEGPFARVNEELIAPASPGEYEDRNVWPETTFWYELRALLADGSEEVISGSPVSATTGGRLVARLSPAIPNPFTGETAIEFESPGRFPRVTLAVYDVRGRLVRRLIDGRVGRGRGVALWDGTDDTGRTMSAGVYFVRFQTGEETKTRKVVLLR